MRQVLTASAGERSLVQEAAAAASCRALMAPLARDAQVSATGYILWLCLCIVAAVGQHLFTQQLRPLLLQLRTSFLAADGASALRELLDNPSDRVRGAGGPLQR